MTAEYKDGPEGCTWLPHSLKNAQLPDLFCKTSTVSLFKCAGSFPRISKRLLGRAHGIREVGIVTLLHWASISLQCRLHTCDWSGLVTGIAPKAHVGSRRKHSLELYASIASSVDRRDRSRVVCIAWCSRQDLSGCVRTVPVAPFYLGAHLQLQASSSGCNLDALQITSTLSVRSTLLPVTTCEPSRVSCLCPRGSPV